MNYPPDRPIATPACTRTTSPGAHSTSSTLISSTAPSRCTEAIPLGSSARIFSGGKSLIRTTGTCRKTGRADGSGGLVRERLVGSYGPEWRAIDMVSVARPADANVKRCAAPSLSTLAHAAGSSKLKRMGRRDVRTQTSAHRVRIDPNGDLGINPGRWRTRRRPANGRSTGFPTAAPPGQSPRAPRSVIAQSIGLRPRNFAPFEDRSLTGL